MKRPNFEKLLPLLKSGNEFSLTESQYEESTGAALPKDFYYLKSKSSFAKKAKEYGYVIAVCEKIICLKPSIPTKENIS